MAVSFGVYGLLRKTVSAGLLVALAVELLLPIAMGIVIWYGASPQGIARWAGRAGDDRRPHGRRDGRRAAHPVRLRGQGHALYGDRLPAVHLGDHRLPAGG